MSSEIGFEERTYFDIGAVGKYGTLYSRDSRIARLTLDSRAQYTLEVTEGVAVDFMAVMDIVNRIFTTRGEKLNKMTRDLTGTFKIETLLIPKTRAIADNPQA